MVTDPLGGRHDKLPRTGRVPTRGQSTDGPIVMGWTQHDDGMEHAWSPTRSTAGRRLRPIPGTEAPSCAPALTAVRTRADSAVAAGLSRAWSRSPSRAPRGVVKD